MIRPLRPDADLFADTVPVFVSRYLTALPSEEQLRRWLSDEREVRARREGSTDG